MIYTVLCYTAFVKIISSIEQQRCYRATNRIDAIDDDAHVFPHSQVPSPTGCVDIRPVVPSQSLEAAMAARQSQT